MTDEFSAPVDTQDPVSERLQRPEPKRDRWGRYILNNPMTGKHEAWTRATTFAKSISDTYALSQWGQRMTAKGMAMRPDLLAMASTMDVRHDRDAMNAVVEQAKDAAGQKAAANLGTALHTFSEFADEDRIKDVPEVYQPRLREYLAALQEGGFTTVPSLMERITAVPAFQVGGKFDRILRLGDGTHVIGDLKTGRDLIYGWSEIAIQLALYAHGVNASGVWNMDQEEWEPGPTVSEEFGIVMHLPAEGEGCTLYRVNLVAGWEAARLCGAVRSWRKTRELATPFVKESSWEERFATVSSLGEASALFRRASRELGNGAELRRLTQIGMVRLKTLEEQAG